MTSRVRNPAMMKAMIAAIRHCVKSARMFEMVSGEQSGCMEFVEVSVANVVDVVSIAIDDCIGLIADVVVVEAVTLVMLVILELVAVVIVVVVVGPTRKEKYRLLSMRVGFLLGAVSVNRYVASGKPLFIV